jgi:hypothetical protein
MPRIFLTDEEKKDRIRQNNIKSQPKRDIQNNKQYFCLGCQSFYGYTHKKRHYNGFEHENRMKILKYKDINHVEQHMHEESNRKDKPKDYKHKNLYDENSIDHQHPYIEKWYEGVIDCSKMNTN